MWQRLRIAVGAVLVISGLLTMAFWTLRIVEPQPSEKLAAESSAQILAALEQISQASSLQHVAGFAEAGSEKLPEVSAMLTELDSDDDTRTRLDAHRTILRGLAIASLATKDTKRWDDFRAAIRTGLTGLSGKDPLFGAINSAGLKVVDLVADLTSERPQPRSVTPQSHPGRQTHQTAAPGVRLTVKPITVGRSP